MESVKSYFFKNSKSDFRLSKVEITRRVSRIDAVLPLLIDRLNPCSLCPRQCGAFRLKGEKGECGLDGMLRVASVARHCGEEPPISGEKGTINIFFSGCNLHCLHCQNWPISQRNVGKNLTIEELAKKILAKWRLHAHSLGWVTPTPQIVPALQAYRLCLIEGLNLPLAHNGGGYENAQIIDLLTGIVDIWLPDAKTANPLQGNTIQGVADYPEKNIEAISRMVFQVQTDDAKMVIVRHLALPGRLDDSEYLLKRLWNRFGEAIHLSLMVQYFPTYKTIEHEQLSRKLTLDEYQSIVEKAQQIGFKKGWVQNYDSECGILLCQLS